MKKLFYLAAAAAFALASCQPAEEPEKIGPNFPAAPGPIEETLQANPEGNPAEAEDATLILSFDIEAEGAWKIEAVEEYDWITVSPTEGEGMGTVVFVTEGNESGKDRIAEFEVKETIEATNAEEVTNGEATTKDVKTYTIIVNQAKKVSNVADGSLAFLQAIVEGNMLGEDTPTVATWYNVTETFPGIALNPFDGGKLEIVGIDGTPFTDLPAVMNLPELTTSNINNQHGLEGKELPKEWNTPKLEYCNIAACGLTGVLPDGFASSTPKLQTVYFNGNNLYGALPHFWAAGANGGTGILECLIGTANKNNVSVDTELPLVHEGQNPGMGYMVPATCDVKLNKWTNDDPAQGHANPSRDLTQIKLGGCTELNYVGFEAGWGQERYVKYGNGLTDDLNTWNDHRLLVDEWASYFSNLGYTDMAVTVPHVMMTWDQAAADAYTNEAKAKWAK